MEDCKGYVQVYTGNGKGKTTASFGLALRAAMAGKKVFIGQFVKGMPYSELKAPEYIRNIEIKQYGADCFIVKAPTEHDIKIARDGLHEMAEILKSGKYDVVIMDEANIALFYKLFSPEELIEAVRNRAEHVEVIITGRYAPQEIIDFADLVTEMKEIKHYYTKGVEARTGIEK
ncbi:cob(I)yrinic acid a,c-diamide adenosyltransferase [bacterium]|nr:cob(I)yrinic acid a,c-diamide adenosyltransferase [bacterium]MBP5592174.1 cob(I)yrinic acid a,c-diamide adenosyltransferase [bacterium]